MKQKKINNITAILFAVAAAVLFCLKFSLSTSPFYGPGLHTHDSAIFFLIGKYWAEGSIPYIDLWDHKGPMIFFINCLGCLIAGKHGVFALQCVFLSAFIFFTFKTFELRFNRWTSAGLSIVSLFWLACSYEGGNLTEEYVLPLLAASVYLTVRWLDDYRRTPCGHNPWNAVLLGAILAFCFLTRLTNGLGAAGATLAIALILIKDRQWKNLLLNAAGFLGGALALILPFAVYFAAKGALDECIFGSFLFNVSNLDAAEGGVGNNYWRANIIPFSIMAVNCFGLAVLSLFVLIRDKERRADAFVWLVSSLMLGWWLFTSSLMSHYRTVAVPFFPALVIMLAGMKGRFLKASGLAVLALLIVGPVFLTLRKWSSFVDYFDRPEAVQVAEELRGDIPPEDLPTTIIYGDPQFYLLLDIKPVYHNFTYPDGQGAKSERLRDDIVKEYSSCKASHILVSGGQVLIDGILRDRYAFVKEYGADGDYKLYERL
ncbi:MAG: hypothetical protein IK045_00775 [Bacteroidales bacterium]|nr:hypothetical protein [Bacteroidales bacterium]